MADFLKVGTGFQQPQDLFKACKSASGGLASILFANEKNLQVSIVGFYLDQQGNKKEYKSNGQQYFAVRLTNNESTGWLSLLRFGAALAKCSDDIKQKFLIVEDQEVKWNINPTQVFFMSFDKDGKIEKIALNNGQQQQQQQSSAWGN
jgi:hypothetical protein